MPRERYDREPRTNGYEEVLSSRGNQYSLPPVYDELTVRETPEELRARHRAMMEVYLQWFGILIITLLCMVTLAGAIEHVLP